MALGKQIHRYRTALGITLATLAEHSGAEVGTLGALETRDSKKSADAQKIAEALGLTVEQLLDESQNYQPKLTHVSSNKFRSTVLTPPPIASESSKLWRPTSWPFSVAIDRVAKLDRYDIGRIDGYMLALVEANENATKSAAHA